MSNDIKKIDCTVHKSIKKDETYIFIPKGFELKDLPSDLIKVLGKTEEVMRLILTPGKKMARNNADEIIKNIEKQGFHLQMPENPQLIENPLAKSNERFLDKDM